jgi:hypothetical protein
MPQGFIYLFRVSEVQEFAYLCNPGGQTQNEKSQKRWPDHVSNYELRICVVAVSSSLQKDERLTFCIFFHFMINGPYHDNMTLPHLADGEGFQIWRVDINIANEESPAVEKAWSSSLAVACEANSSST